MCATCGPADYNYRETMSTLRCANRAKNIKNKPRINEDPKDAMLRDLSDQIAALKAKLKGGGGGGGSGGGSGGGAGGGGMGGGGGGMGGGGGGALLAAAMPPGFMSEAEVEELESQIRKDGRAEEKAQDLQKKQSTHK